MTREPLTPRQLDVFNFIAERIRGGLPPTLREIGEDLGLVSTNGVSDHLKALVSKGYITRDHNKTRSIRVVGETAHASECENCRDLIAMLRRCRPALTRFEVGGKVHEQDPIDAKRLEAEIMERWPEEWETWAAEKAARVREETAKAEAALKRATEFQVPPHENAEAHRKIMDSLKES